MAETTRLRPTSVPTNGSVAMGSINAELTISMNLSSIGLSVSHLFKPLAWLHVD